MESLQEMIPSLFDRYGKARGTAIAHYLQYMIDKCVDYNDRLGGIIPAALLLARLGDMIFP